MSRAVAYPAGSWPREMLATVAAAYCGEPSVEAFLSKVAKGIYPQPVRGKGLLPKWHRLKLDAAIDQRHGLQSGLIEIDDAAALIG